MNTADTNQIVAAFETQGVLPEAIAEAEGCAVGAIKAVLMQHSVKYRALCRAEPAEETNFNFTVAERKEAKKVLVTLMRHSDDEVLQAKIAIHIDNEENRNRASRGMLGAGSININQFQIIMEQANAALEHTETKRAKVVEELPRPQTPTLDTKIKKSVKDLELASV